jgi:pyruvate dehydrogenase E2 component (dihydrolipoamide acetyltransferase)
MAILYIGVEAGSSVPVDGVIAMIGEEGADYQKLLAAQKSSAKIRRKELLKQQKLERRKWLKCRSF